MFKNPNRKQWVKSLNCHFTGTAIQVVNEYKKRFSTLLAIVCVYSVRSESLQSRDCGLPGSSVHGILQAKILERVTISFSRKSYWPRDGNCISCMGRRILYRWATPKQGCKKKWDHGQERALRNEKQMLCVGFLHLTAASEDWEPPRDRNPVLLPCSLSQPRALPEKRKLLFPSASLSVPHLLGAGGWGSGRDS